MINLPGKAGFYLRQVEQGLKRAACLLDRRGWSETFGCVDREYWNWRTTVEFPRISYQSCFLALSLAQKLREEKSLFAAYPFQEWISAILRFSLSHQNSDGSFNEFYPNDRNFCATASFLASLQSFLAGAPDPEARKRAELMLERGRPWLDRYWAPPPGNQRLAALLALHAAPGEPGRRRYLLVLHHRSRHVSQRERIEIDRGQRDLPRRPVRRHRYRCAGGAVRPCAHTKLPRRRW